MSALLAALVVLAAHPADPRDALSALSCTRLDMLTMRQGFHVATLRSWFEESCRPASLELTDARCSEISTALIETQADLGYVVRLAQRKGCTWARGDK